MFKRIHSSHLILTKHKPNSCKTKHKTYYLV